MEVRASLWKLLDCELVKRNLDFIFSQLGFYQRLSGMVGQDRSLVHSKTTCVCSKENGLEQIGTGIRKQFGRLSK